MYKVLYVEDEIDMIEDLAPVLKDLGLDVIAQRSIEKALQLFSEVSFDAVLLDICMPPSADIDPKKVEYGRETGIEVARRLREQNSDIPIIALTVVNDPEIKERMKNAGITKIINKPADAHAILNAILDEIKSDK
jgi:CheY-like chemotaxis protein